MGFSPENNKPEKPFFMVSFDQNPKTFFYIYFSEKRYKNSNFGQFWVLFLGNLSNQSFSEKLGSVHFQGLWFM